MDAPPTPHTPENWGAASRGYARSVAPTLMEPFAAEHAERLGLGADADVLEVGAGSGALTETLCRRVRSVLATDFAPDMIEVLGERMRRCAMTNVRCEVMDGQDLGLEDGSFDGAASSFALMLFPDRAKGFSELRRVLRPGGRAVVSGWADPSRFEGYRLLLEGVRSAFPELPAPPSPPPVFSLSDPAEFEAQMEAAGFREVEVDYVAREIEVADAECFWTLFSVGAPPVKALFERAGPGGRERIREALAEVVERRFGSGPVLTTNVATIGTGTAP